MSSEGVTLTPGEIVDRELSPGALHVYGLELPAGSVWTLTAEQRGLDIELSLSAPDGEPILTVDSPLDRWGTEWLRFRTEAAGRYRLVVRPRETVAPPGEYQLRLQASRAGEARAAAESVRTSAGRHYAAQDRARALAAYQRAAAEWLAVGQPAEEVRDAYCVTVLHRLLGASREALRAASEVVNRWRDLGDHYWEAATHNEIGLNLWTLDDIDAARESFQQAVVLRRSLGDRFGELKARSNICLMYLTQGQVRTGRECFDEVLGELEEEDESSLAASLHTNLGWANDALGEPDAALSHYRKALGLARAARDAKGEGKALNNLAMVYRDLGELDQALASYEQSLDVFQDLEDPHWRARLLANIGLTYSDLGDTEFALPFLRQALALRQELSDRRGEMHSHNGLGMASRRLGNFEGARRHHRSALTIAHELEDPRLESLAYVRLGRVALDLGDPRGALDHGVRALTLARMGEDPERTAESHELIGRSHQRVGNPQAAIRHFEQALEIHRARRDTARAALALTELARSELAIDHFDEAESHLVDALKHQDDLRLGLVSDDLRSSFQGSRRATHELLTTHWMARHRRTPHAGHDHRALEAGEMGRARALLDLLSESVNDMALGMAPEIRERRVHAARRWAAKAERHRRLVTRDPSSAEAATAALEMSSARHELDRIEAEIRRRDPRYAALTRPRPLSAESIQGLLDPKSAMLYYALGGEASVLFWVTSEEIWSFDLPGRGELEGAVRQLHGFLSSPGQDDRRFQTIASKALGDVLLGPVADRLSGQRLVIVADGALHYLPFGSLLLAGESEPLVTRHEIVYLPSASMLAEQRRRRSSRRSASAWLAVVADPVFDRTDPRVTQDLASTIPQRPSPMAMRRGNDVRYERLTGSRREAEAIAALAPGQTWSALGFAANRQIVLGPELGKYEILHFATHGILDTRNPRLSGLVFSTVDSAGRPQDGFLRLHDVYDLDLAAELVVLSGCSTALGREIRGEGLVGLTRGFMYAGVPRVLASLWSVDDQATAELMVRFYRALRQDSATVAAALRQAQREIRSERRWRDPYYWAGFVLQGEWR